ncbi:MAG TPA: hypothetical protein VIL46_08190 [Gemmataceae bacterium]
MSTPEPDLFASADDAWLLEMLADDELSPEQREQLLARLAAQPDGWRRCAEAFLAAQAIRRTLRESAPAAPAVPRRRKWLPRLAAAAAVLAAFGLGLAWPRSGADGGRAGDPGAVAVRDGGADTPAAEAPDPEDAHPAERLIAAVWPDARRLHQISFETRIDNGLVTYATPDPLPVFLLEALSGAGHRVEFVPRSVEVRLENGQTVKMPFTETRIIPRENFHL